jgi:hypothetical protein
MTFGNGCCLLAQLLQSHSTRCRAQTEQIQTQFEIFSAHLQLLCSLPAAGCTHTPKAAPAAMQPPQIVQVKHM